MSEQWLLVVQIFLINIVLSGDNSVVIALISKNLPIRQRQKAIWLGSVGAVILRIILTFAAERILSIAYIQALGALCLIGIAIMLLTDADEHTSVKKASTLFQAIWTIVTADFIMSLDNVLAIAAASGNHLIVMIIGVASSIPIIVWGSTLVVKLLHKFPFLVYIGAAILGYTAGDMFENDLMVQKYLISGIPEWIIPVLTTLLVISAGLLVARSRKRQGAKRHSLHI